MDVPVIVDVPLLTQLKLPIIFFFISLSIRAIFAFLETSITALRLFKLKEMARKVGKYESLFQTLEKDPHRLMITTLVASSCADVVSAALATHIAETICAHFHFSSGVGFSVGVSFATVAIIIFGEIIPKNLAKERGEKIFISMLWLINAVYKALYPLVSILVRFSDRIITFISGKSHDGGSEWVSSEREVRFLIEYTHAKGLLEAEKTEMIQNIFELGSTPVKEIMVPAPDVISLPADDVIQDALATFSKYRFTRLPVYKGRTDNIIGMLHQKDLFDVMFKGEKKKLEELIRPILFVPESMKINQLLREFRDQHMHIAIVLNEHGSTIGLITLEDVLEEIVGEISDEHEPATQHIIPLSQDEWLVEAPTPLEDLEDFFNISFETEDAVTLGGFLSEQLQHLPKKGERVIYKGFIFQIQKASLKRVRQVLVFKQKDSTDLK